LAPLLQAGKSVIARAACPRFIAGGKNGRGLTGAEGAVCREDFLRRCDGCNRPPHYPIADCARTRGYRYGALASEGGRAQKSRGPSRYGLTATNPSTALRQRAVSQLQHSPKFGTHGFTSPDPHTIAYETWLASTVPLVGARGAIGIVLSSGKNPLQFSARSLLPDGAPKEPACQPLLSSMMTTIS
jgi:hypothetical protein